MGGRIVGWAMGPSIDQSLAVDAWVMALTHRRPRAGLIFHSDRGSRYRTPEECYAL